MCVNIAAALFTFGRTIFAAAKENTVPEDAFPCQGCRGWKSVSGDRIGTKTPRGCILWSGTINLNGYGQMGFSRRLILAHRLSYELMIGPIPEGMAVCHRCDNPPCINPIHLFVGTAAMNMADKVAKGRQNKGERHGRAKLSEQAVLEIRRRYFADGKSQADLSREFKLDRRAIHSIIRGKSWRHLSETPK